MKTKLLYAAALLALVFVSAGAASRSGFKPTAVLRTTEDGRWQMFLWTPPCPQGRLMLLSPKDPADPVKLECVR